MFIHSNIPISKLKIEYLDIFQQNIPISNACTVQKNYVSMIYGSIYMRGLDSIFKIVQYGFRLMS